MTETKTTLFSLENRDWKNDKVESKNLNKLLLNIPTGNITRLNEQTYARATLLCYSEEMELKYKTWMGN